MILITIAGYIAAIGSVYCAAIVSDICTPLRNDYVAGMIVCAIAAIICSAILITL